MSNKFVLNADDFGMSEAYNEAIKEGYSFGVLKSTSLTANGEAFDGAVEKVLPECPELGVGVHLNIIEGKSLNKELNTLTDSEGNFNNSYIQMLIKAYKDKEFLEQVEKEFRSQIEKVRDKGINITHLDSHVHTHSIPPIFKIVCKLANEYGIKQVRTQCERFYIIPDLFIHLSIKYFVNLIKVVLLKYFTIQNKITVRQNNLKTNDYLIGVAYTSMMSGLTVACGLDVLKNKRNIVAEALIHPCRYEDGTIDNHFMEFLITKNKKLMDKIGRLNFEISNYKQSEEENEGADK